jgi:hypothetical protein
MKRSYVLRQCWTWLGVLVGIVWLFAIAARVEAQAEPPLGSPTHQEILHQIRILRNQISDLGIGCAPSPFVLPRGSKLITPGKDPNALCCGSCSGGVCQNCALLPPLSMCVGTILACPNGEVLTDEGEGSCAE